VALGLRGLAPRLATTPAGSGPFRGVVLQVPSLHSRAHEGRARPRRGRHVQSAAIWRRRHVSRPARIAASHPGLASTQTHYRDTNQDAAGYPNAAAGVNDHAVAAWHGHDEYVTRSVTAMQTPRD
jgi:hypothetical protein